MLINGAWTQCDDGIIRPLIAGSVADSNGLWVPAEFLIDTGADRTVLTAPVLDQLGLRRSVPAEQLGGLGGTTDSVLVETKIRLVNETGNSATLRGNFAAVTRATALDISVLGRDILDLFAVIVDRASDVVCLLSQRHSYKIIHR